MRVKVCGITRVEDARLSVELGAFAIGFIFVPGSPRFVRADQAREIARELPEGVERVGVFARSSVEEIRAVREAVGLTAIQLHGAESADIARVLGPCVIRALRPRSLDDIETLAGYPAKAFLIDGERSGERVDPALARSAKRFGPVILAGGLRAENVARAIAEVAPIAVDVCSGVESAPGIKDARLLKRFFAAVEGQTP